jgi:asparagine synthase (glutamine-hydrolysing)
MCGICGFTGRDDALLERMKDAIRHRGPDADGSWSDGQISLGHRRLSIVDLSESGRQPLTNEDGSIWITFNGEIYNHTELRRELEAKGHRFKSRTDTEAIVHGYEEWGDDVVRRLTGMFAFAIWDARRRRLLLARDRLGIKPLYWAQVNGRFSFASEIKALLQDPGLPRDVSRQGLFDVMGYEFTPAPGTLFAHVHKLLPAHVLVLDADGRVETRRYWSLERREIDATPEALRALLGQVCADHTMSDVPLGAFLSGGIDSSTVVQFLAYAVPFRLQTFALGYPEESFSEFDFARQVAKYFDTDHRELLVRPMDAATIEQSVWHLDEPTTDPSNLPFMLICEQARKYVTVCLSGDGGDELLMGYDRFRASKASHMLDLVPLPFRRSVYQGIIALLPDDDRKKGPRNILKRFLQGAALSPEGEHIRWQYFMDPAYAGRLFRPELLAAVNQDPFAPIKRWSQEAPRDRGAREQFIDLNTVLPDSVLMKVDKMAMAHSLEVRPPFLDHRVVEYCYSLPTALKLRGFETKWLLKEAMEPKLPPGIARRKKQGFSFPMKNWLRADLMGFARDEIFSSPLVADHFDLGVVRQLWEEHQAKRHNHSHMLWTLLNVAIWERRMLRAPSASPAPAVRRDPVTLV